MPGLATVTIINDEIQEPYDIVFNLGIGKWSALTECSNSDFQQICNNTAA